MEVTPGEHDESLASLGHSRQPIANKERLGDSAMGFEWKEPEWIADLKARHALLFRSIHPSNFGVGEGWKGIVTGLCEDLDALGLTDLVVVQVKEKFGGLRFYVQGEGDDAREAVSALIREAEAKAWLTCDTCGAPGDTRQMATLCHPCRDKEQASRA